VGRKICNYCVIALGLILVFAPLVLGSQRVDGNLVVEGYVSSPLLPAIPQQYGAAGNGKYNTSGDSNGLQAGATDDTTAITAWLAARKATNSTGGHEGGAGYLLLPSNVFWTTGAFTINDHYTTISGQGYGASMIHANVSGGNQATPVLTFQKSVTGNAWNDLLSGGGLQGLTLKTDNSSIRNIALNLEYVEKMRFRDLQIEGFGVSAIEYWGWEGYLENIHILAAGALQTNTSNLSNTGVIYFGPQDATNPNYTAYGYADNTIVNGLDMSGCYGTWLYFNSYTGQTAGIQINRFTAETSPGTDAGGIDNVPIIYANKADVVGISDMQFQVNTTGVTRRGHWLRMDGATSQFSIGPNSAVSMNPTSGITTRVTQRLSDFAFVNQSDAILNLGTGFTLADKSDSIGYQETGGEPPLFTGTGTVNFQGLRVQVLDSSLGSYRRATNVFARTLNATGDMHYESYITTGAYHRYYRFDSGVVTYFSNSLPTALDHWVAGDKVQYGTNGVAPGGYSGMVCTQSGNTGTLSGVTGTTTGAPTYTITVNAASNLLVGDYVALAGGASVNIISAINGNTLTVQLSEPNNVTNGSLSFFAPIWKGYGAIQN